MRYTPVMEKIHLAPLYEQLARSPAKAVARAEQDFRQKIMEVCQTAMGRRAQIIQLTGPSSSGKTTAARMLAAELLRRGKEVFHISLDDFYKDVKDLPLWEDGAKNCETVESLDLEYFRHVVDALFKNGRAQFPIYDFAVKRRSPQFREVAFGPATYLIVEGIHALNPEITGALEAHASLKVYISVHSDFVDEDGGVLLCARDLRLMRRILRDLLYRTTTAQVTLEMWDYVVKGESLYIQPFRKGADLHLNSTHGYEPFLYKDALARALCALPPDSAHKGTAARLLDASELFFQLKEELVPADSLIREFI